MNRNHPVSAHRRQQGYTLVEMMIAMLIGLILSAGMMQIFMSSKQSYRVQDGLGRLQEDARFAMGFLTREVRMAGFTGCFKGSPSSFENILNNPSAFTWDTTNMVSGNEATGAGTWSPALDASLAGSVKSGTDVISIRRMASQGIDLTPPYNDSSQLFVTNTGDLSIGDILMVTDCTKGSIFQATNIAFNSSSGKYNVVHSNSSSYAPGNSNPHLANSYGAGAEVAKLVATTFFVGTGADGEPALFERTLGASGGNAATATNQELVEDVEDMQILYGIDTDADGSANEYLTADAVGDTSQVVSVRISLLLRTATDNLASTAQSLSYNGGTLTASDRRLRRVFNTTIKLRNRGML